MRRVLLAFTAIIVGIVFASGSVMLLTDNHLFMPDNQLYDLQILAESVRLSLTLNPVERAALSLDWVSRRLNEVESMANTRFLPAALANLEAELDTAVHHILNVPAADQSPLLEQLDRLLIRAESVLAAIESDLPALVALRTQISQLRQVNTPDQLHLLVAPDLIPADVEGQPVPFLDEKFDHSFFPLSGGHAGVTCTLCHEQGIYSGTAVSCSACHEPPPDHFEGSCDRCHLIDNWTTVNFDHIGATDCQSCHLADRPPNHYPGHCTACHITESWQMVNFDHTGFTDCAACHSQQAPANHFPGQCSSCHTTDGWRPANFDHSGFNDCVACHSQQAPANHFPGQCSTCHITRKWDDVEFSHDGFTDCQSCHTPPNDEEHVPPVAQCSTCHTDTDRWRIR